MQYNAEKTFTAAGDGATMVQQQQNFMIKLAFGADERRIVTLEQPSYDLLAQKVASALGLPVNTFVLRYVDEEKDLITASSDEELQLALNYAAPSGVLRLQVVQLQERSAIVGDKKRRKHEAVAVDDVDPQAVAFLVELLREQHGREVKPKKCAKLLRKTGGDVALAQSLIAAWCAKRDAKDIKKREKKALKQQLKKKEHKKTKLHGSADDGQEQRGEDEESSHAAEETPELKAKLDQLEAKGHAKRRKNAKLLFKCHGDVDKVLEVLDNKEARKEAKREWKRSKRSQKGDKKLHKREHKLERKGSKTAFKQIKKQHKHEAKLRKQQYRLGYQELSVAPSSPKTLPAA